MGMYDQSQAGSFKSLNLSASVSFHKALDEEGTNNIGIGFQFTYASRVINYSDLNFATQFDGSGFDTHLPSYETIGRQRTCQAPSWDFRLRCFVSPESLASTIFARLHPMEPSIGSAPVAPLSVMVPEARSNPTAS